MHKTNGAIPAPSQDPRFGEEFFDEPKFNEAEKGVPHFEQERRDEDVASERKREKTTEEFSGRLKPDGPVLVGEDNVFPIEHSRQLYAIWRNRSQRPGTQPRKPSPCAC